MNKNWKPDKEECLTNVKQAWVFLSAILQELSPEQRRQALEAELSFSPSNVLTCELTTLEDLPESAQEEVLADFDKWLKEPAEEGEMEALAAELYEHGEPVLEFKNSLRKQYGLPPVKV